MACNPARPMTTPTAQAALMRSVRALGVSLCLGTLFLAGCSSGDSFTPGVPVKVKLADTTFTFSALGQNHLFSAAALDGGGDPVNTTLHWSTSDPAVVHINGDGLATAVYPGSATISVSSGSMTDTATITVAQVPVHLEIVLGDQQTGVPGQPLVLPLMVQVTDALRYPIAGTLVQFHTTDPGTSLSSDTATTGSFGVAQSIWTLGPAMGAYSATATVPGTDLSVGFTAQAAPAGPFNIELAFVSGPPDLAQAQAFAAAEARWESIITADLPDDFADIPAGVCGGNPAISRPIDDLVIFVNLTEIDGPGGILGQAGPCYFHEVGLLPAIGQMTFDVADLDAMAQSGVLTAVVTHEMGHVLGFGTVWDAQGLLVDAKLAGGIDPHFIGVNALAAFDNAGGATYPGAKVPVEDQGGYGTADAHWRESVFANELMTGYINDGANPLSAVSIAAMADAGYQVDMTKADGFSLMSAAARSPGKGIRLHLQNDIAKGPMGIINKKGQIIGTYPRR
jgi:hypothetical protein